MKEKRKRSEELKRVVQKKYDTISRQSKERNSSTCCGAGSSSDEVYNIMTDSYDKVAGYSPDADLGLGCGLPTEFAQLEKGDTVIDLGSGAGNDCFVARHEVGPTGKVIGIDFTDSMIKKARANAEKLGYNNVEFRHGDIEVMPVSDNISDVIVSNCVLNLVPDKPKVFSEMFRVLKPGGHFSISDIVLRGVLPEALREDAEMYAGCVAGAVQLESYLGYIEEAGFEQITLQNEKPITIPDEILARYLSGDELDSFRKGETGIYSITVYAEKPVKKEKPEPVASSQEICCEPGSGCC